MAQRGRGRGRRHRHHPGWVRPEEKLFLGWLDYTEVDKGESGQYTLSPSEKTYKGADQAIKVNLPNSERENQYVTPHRGRHSWWSGRGDELTTP